MSLKFVGTLPPKSKRTDWAAIRYELRTRPGEWAEIGRYPKSASNKAAADSMSVRRGHADIQSRYRTVGDEVFVYAVAVA